MTSVWMLIAWLSTQHSVDPTHFQGAFRSREGCESYKMHLDEAFKDDEPKRIMVCLEIPVSDR